ncbi:MAG: M14 family metallopeptidase [Peptoniphilaceae bacterium]|nr:M14 family metallopeptidase [Peptoniphilaceae bacterium]
MGRHKSQWLLSFAVASLLTLTPMTSYADKADADASQATEASKTALSFADGVGAVTESKETVSTARLDSPASEQTDETANFASDEPDLVVEPDPEVGTPERTAGPQRGENLPSQPGATAPQVNVPAETAEETTSVPTEAWRATATPQKQMILSRTDAKAKPDEKVQLSMTEERSYRVVVPFDDMTQEQLEKAQVQWAMFRASDELPNDPKLFPNQYLGGALEDWKTVHTADRYLEEDYPSIPLFKDVKTTVEMVDGKPSLVLTFANEKLLGFDGIDVRDRGNVRAAMMDYFGTYHLSLILDGEAVAQTDIDYRPYDAYRSQAEVDAEIPVAVQEAKDNGIYAESVEIGKSAQNRPIQAVFVSESQKDLEDYQALRKRMMEDPQAVLKELREGTLQYKVPVMYSNVHADEIVGTDAVMEFLRTLTRNETFTYRQLTGLTEAGKAELAIEMEKDGSVWSELIADKVQGIGYIRGNGGISNGVNYDGGIDASADLTEEEFQKYYTSEIRTFDPRQILSKMFFILVPSENVDARVVNSRTNGNGFDLNRDNTYQTQPETQAMTSLISQWNPISFHEFHGYYQYYQVEPCSPTHDPNNEYDLFIDTAMAQGEAFAGASVANNETMNSAKIPMRDYLMKQEDGTRFWQYPFDDMSTSYTPQYAMMHGTNAFTVESAYAHADAVTALQYGSIGNADFVAQNRDKMFENQLLRFVRGMENIDAETIRPWYVDQQDNPGANAQNFRPNDNENHNFFPEYYVIPMDAKHQEDRKAAQDTIALLLRNDVKVSRLNQAVTLEGKTYEAGTIVVNMHQAKRNMANTVLYPNLVISDWTEGSLYSEPVTNFAQLRGFDMDTIRKVGVFDGALEEITEVPKLQSAVTGKGPISVIANNSTEAIRAVNDILLHGGKVGLITEGKNRGNFVTLSSAVQSLGGRYVLDVVKGQDVPKAALIQNAITLFVPKADPDESVADKDGNPVGMLGYYNRLNTNGNWDFFALDKQMGFHLTDDLGQASLVVGSQYPSNTEDVVAKVEAGTPYIGYTTDALQFVKDEKLADIAFKLDNNWSGFDALSVVNYPTADLTTATYENEKDYIMYGYGGDYFLSVPDGAKVLIQTSADDELLEGFMTEDYMKDYKGSVQAILLEQDGKTLRLFANTLTNKAHQQDDYRYLANAIYAESLTGDELVIEINAPTTEAIQDRDGLTLSDIRQNGGAILVNGERIQGHFVWATPNVSPSVGKGVYRALFVPDDGSDPYNVEVEVTVNAKANAKPQQGDVTVHVNVTKTSTVAPATSDISLSASVALGLVAGALFVMTTKKRSQHQ